ncbi:MAG: RNA methyltransferase [Desulfarculaceae bacterium]|nr:RNA methyltransferase [Desulfarculaceae bacterium]
MPENDLYLALLHYPVMNRKGWEIGSALTTIDLHDIARAAVTFGVKGFYVATPFEDQQKLALKVIGHWTAGAGGLVNPDRKDALGLVRITGSFEEVCASIQEETGKDTVRVATSADRHEHSVPAERIKERMKDGPCVLTFGTAWGLSKDFIDGCDMRLDPITGKGDYNHLSVRSAVSIYLDRICNGL